MSRLQAQRHKVSQVARKMARTGVGLELRTPVERCQHASRDPVLKQPLTVGGGFCSVIISTFMGGYLANGA